MLELCRRSRARAGLRCQGPEEQLPGKYYASTLLPAPKLPSRSQQAGRKPRKSAYRATDKRFVV
jgi:hypothetical protein